MRDMPTDSGAWQALALRVVDERAAHGWTQADVAERGGFSVDRLQEIEKGELTRYRPTTLGGLERGLGWSPGSVRRVLQGQEPLRNPEVTEPASTTADTGGEDAAALSEVAAAILRDTDLIEEAREHLLNQYELLRRLSSQPISSEAPDSKKSSRRAETPPDLPRDDEEMIARARARMDKVRGRRGTPDSEEIGGTGKRSAR